MPATGFKTGRNGTETLQGCDTLEKNSNAEWGMGETGQICTTTLENGGTGLHVDATDFIGIESEMFKGDVVEQREETQGAGIPSQGLRWLGDGISGVVSMGMTQSQRASVSSTRDFEGLVVDEKDVPQGDGAEWMGGKGLLPGVPFSVIEQNVEMCNENDLKGPVPRSMLSVTHRQGGVEISAVGVEGRKEEMRQRVASLVSTLAWMSRCAVRRQMFGLVPHLMEASLEVSCCCETTSVSLCVRVCMSITCCIAPVWCMGPVQRPPTENLSLWGICFVAVRKNLSSWGMPRPKKE